MTHGTDNTPMNCENKGLWHLGVSEEACENAGGTWYRAPCITLKETIDNRESRFDLDNAMSGTCQSFDNFNRWETAFVSVSNAHDEFSYDTTHDGCAKFCQSLPNYSSMIGMSVVHDICTCVYENGKRPSRELIPSYATPSPPTFTLTNTRGMTLGLRPLINCDSTDNLLVETQVSDPSNARQQWRLTHDGQIVSVKCPDKVLTTLLDVNGVCSAGRSLSLSKAMNDEGSILSSQEFVIGSDEIECFSTKSDLQDAVDACASPSDQGSEACEEVKFKHGWPMNLWCESSRVAHFFVLYFWLY